VSFEVVVKDAFLKDFMAVPQSTQNGITRCIGRLEQDPFRAPNVKRVFKQQYENVYRVRLGDYRLIYAVGNRVISLLAVGRRGDIYRRYLGDSEVLMTAQEAKAARPKVLQTTPFDQHRSWYPSGTEESWAPEDRPEIDDQHRAQDGPFAELLDHWRIPHDQRRLILRCSSLQEILELDLPEETIKVVQHWYNPPTLQQLDEQPDFSLENVTDLERFRDGTLTRFLLKLSPEQERVAARSLQGPALVKGGPGTGKSLVALYRVKNLLDPKQYKLFEPLPRILFLTYGKSLMNASKQLLSELIPDRLDQVVVTNLDPLVRQIVLSTETDFTPLHDLASYVQEAKDNVLTAHEEKASTAWFTLADLRANYLVEEIEWVVEGRRIRSLEQYLQTERIGRIVPFGQALRTLVWEVYQETLRLSAEKGRSWEYYRGLALDALQEQRVKIAQYDVVIVDEAQDLSPVSLALCAELCKSPRGLFFTADANQSIYNRGFSWSKVHEFLDFRGRSTILHHNYRSTKQIAAACRGFLGASELDAETLVTSSVHQGPKPQVFVTRSCQEQYEKIAEFLENSAHGLRLPVWTGTVLTLSNKQASDVAAALSNLGLRAKHVKGDELHLKEKVVKVMTLHTSKGLEFPTVVIAHVEKDSFPGLKADLTDQGEIREFEECRRKLLFVGASRAMRRLALFANGQDLSPFVHALSRVDWDFNTISFDIV
jgi:superfamily I DNA/RNA helicase/mRNA-degrading endonuclease RelE of RelBE toxin-antitoxin system